MLFWMAGEISADLMAPWEVNDMSYVDYLKSAEVLQELRVLKHSPLNEAHIFLCIGKIFCVEFQRVPLKFHTKYLTHASKDQIIS